VYLCSELMISMLKRLLGLSLFLALAFSSQVVQAQSLTLDYFTVTPSGSDMLIRWQVPDESGITSFKLDRKIAEDPDFQQLVVMTPNGMRSYEYLDYTLFRGEPRTVNYRLQITKSGMVYSYYVNIMHNPTSVQRTWGSIKAMFR
jgi:hypothetical protein